jgi:hypothetical protein
MLNTITSIIISIFSKLFSKTGLIALIGLLALVFIASLKNRFIQSDENWFGEQAYWLLHEGVIKLKSMPLVNQNATIMYGAFKLHVYTGSLLIWIFGWHIWPLKVFTFLVFLFFLNKYRKFIQQYFASHGPVFGMLSIFVLLSTPLVLEQSIVFRPDIALMAMGFGSFVFLYKALKENNENLVYWAGLLSGTAFLFHFNGNVFSVAGFVYLLSYRKYKAVLKFSVVAIIVSFLYFWDLLSVEKINCFISEFKNVTNESVQLKGNLVFIRLKAVLTEHQRFFWSYRVMATSALFLVSLLAFYKSLVKQMPEILRYLLILVICLNLFGAYVAERYLLYHLPYIAIIIAFSIQKIIEKRKVWLSGLFILLFMFQVFNLYASFKMVFRNNYNHSKVNHEIISHVPLGNRVLAPWDFVYNEIGNYQILSYKNIEYFNFKKVDSVELKSIIDTLNVNYIIVSRELEAISPIKLDSTKIHGIFDYHVIYAEPNYVVLKKN